MNEALVLWVVDHSPAEGTAYQAQLALAIAADARRQVRAPQPELAARARLGLSTFRRAVRDLIDAQLVEVVEQPTGTRPALLRLLARPERARCRPPGASAPVDDESARSERAGRDDGASAPIPNQLLLTQDLETTGSHRSPRPYEVESRAIVKRVWEAKNPKPLQPFIAIVKIAERMFDRGWTADEIERVMIDAPTISFAWCEAERDRQRRRLEIPSVLDEPRSGPTFVADPIGQTRPRAAAWVCAVGNPHCVNGNVDDPDRPAGVPVSRCACQTKGN